MPDRHSLTFGAFRMDLDDERLWRGQEALRLTNKAFAVLRYLTANAEQFVTKEALLEAVWPETFVGDAVLTVCIREVRQALGDHARTPQFIETVRGRGYRFIVPVTAGDRSPTQPAAAPPPPAVTRGVASLVGREAELAQLHQWLATAHRGDRQLGFITGEAGIGKSALADVFIEQIKTDADLWIAHGQCIEQYGAGEAYLPILEALGRLCRAPGGADLIDLLRHQAPSWLLQMPALLPTDALEELHRRGGGATRDRMLRELAEAIETLTAERGLVLVLEDLHWSDVSTLDWLAYIARRRDHARLLVLGTYRPVEAMVHAHPLRTVSQELLRQSQCHALHLAYLSEMEVTAYLARRFDGNAWPGKLAQAIHRRTNGNPLFLVTLVDEMARQEALEGDEAAVVEVPASLRQLIEQHLELVPAADQELLEAASVVGTSFSAEAVADGVGLTAEDIEARCTALVRRGQFIHSQGAEEWPDGTVATCYGFTHALYQEVLYERVSMGRRVRLHQQIGVRKETAYGDQARDIAAELAVHFVRGRDRPRAVQYLLYAGENAAQRSAHQEALTHLTTGIELLRNLPDIAERARSELRLQLVIGALLVRTKGEAAPEVEHAYVRASTLCQQVDATAELYPVLHGLWLFYLARAELQTALEVAKQRFSLAQQDQAPELLVGARWILGTTLFYLGQLTSAPEDLEEEVALSDVQQRLVPDLQGSVTANLAYTAWVLWVLGYPDQALRRSHEALTLAQERAHPYSLTVNLSFAARLHQFRCEAAVTQQQAEAAAAVATEQVFPSWIAFNAVLLGWSRAVQGETEAGLAQLRQGLDAYSATGAELSKPYFLSLLAELLGRAGHAEAGLAVLADALAEIERTNECWWEAELYRLRGELLWQTVDTAQGVALAEPETNFLNALDVARSQGAKSLELRAAVSLGRLWRHQGRSEDAHQLVAEVYGWFTEGFDTADLQEAKALLEALVSG